MGRGHSAGMVATMLAMAVAPPVMAVGGFPTVGSASVATSALAAVVATAFPENRIRSTGDRAGDKPGWAAVLVAGLAEVRRSRRVRSTVVAVALVVSVWGALDEYTPLLVEATGVAETRVPLLLLVIYVGVVVGGLFARRAG